MELMKELDIEFISAAGGEGLGPGIAQAVRAALNTSR